MSSCEPSLITQEPVTQAQAVRMAEDIGAVTYVETSALTGEGCVRAFEEAAVAAFREKKSHPHFPPTRPTSLSSPAKAHHPFLHRLWFGK